MAFLPERPPSNNKELAVTTPYDSQQVKKCLAERGAQVEAYLAHCLDSIPMQGRLKEAMYYSLLAGGKRLRPVLCLSTASLFGLDSEKAMPFAAALEMIHTYSLIHDDLPAMDDDDLRRGRPSCHKAFDEATAILAGDALLTNAFGFMASVAGAIPAERVLKALSAVSCAAGAAGMVGGQILDMDCTGKTDVPLETLQTLHALKTGALFRVACISGGLLAGASETELDSLRAYGEALGVTFQIVDDILDETADTATLGKPVGSDAEMGKTTYPSLIGLDRSRELAQTFAEKAVAGLGGFSGTDAAFLKGLALMLVTRKK